MLVLASIRFVKLKCAKRRGNSLSDVRSSPLTLPTRVGERVKTGILAFFELAGFIVTFLSRISLSGHQSQRNDREGQLKTRLVLLSKVEFRSVSRTSISFSTFLSPTGLARASIYLKRSPFWNALERLRASIWILGTPLSLHSQQGKFD